LISLGVGTPRSRRDGDASSAFSFATENKYGQTWDIPNLFVIGSSTFPSMSGFNPTLTIQALAFMSADVIATKTGRSRACCCNVSLAPFGTTVIGRFANLTPAIWLYPLNTILISAVAFQLLALTQVESGEGLADRQTSLAILVISSGLAIAWILFPRAL
jgi:GMC oxidoreductase